MDLPYLQLFALLEKHQVRYSIIGGLALNLQGISRATEDIDLCYARDRTNLKALAEALKEIHPSLRGVPKDLPFILDEATLRQGLNFTLDTDYGPVDILGEVSGIGAFDKVDAVSDQMTLSGHNVLVLSLDGLVVAKRAAGRIKDLMDLGLLEKAMKK